MSTLEATSPWIASRDQQQAAGRLARTLVSPTGHAPERMPDGALSLRRIVDGAVGRAEGEAIRHALAVTQGNKSRAARFLQTNYTTLHLKMKRYGISAREFRG